MIHDLKNIENIRIDIQASLDSAKTALERNKLGQFATPTYLSTSITNFVLKNYLCDRKRVNFLEPALGTGSFYSALLASCKNGFLGKAVGVEFDIDFFNASQTLWKSYGLQTINANFLNWNTNDRFDFVLTNPPYVRHHYIDEESKLACRLIASQYEQISVSGLSGLYVYFLLRSISLMAENGIGVWLIPSEWMNVNYGKALRQLFTLNVKLLHIHNYNISDVKFEDALVSSSVVIFQNSVPSKDSTCKLSYGTDINSPSSVKEIPLRSLSENSKWLNLFNGKLDSCNNIKGYYPRLGDFFMVKRGIATGSNGFFIKPKQEFDGFGIPSDFVKPILPPSRELKSLIIESDRNGYPKIENKLAILDTNVPISLIKAKCPALFSYLTSDKASEVSSSYLASRRMPWYSQEKRPNAPFLCTYMGRNGTNKKIFRFFYNKSNATATNGYLLLIPRYPLADYIAKHPDFSLKILDFLNSIPDEHLISNGRNYGGGLYKMEPKELSNLDASFIAESLGIKKTPASEQLSLFSSVQEPHPSILRPGTRRPKHRQYTKPKAAARTLMERGLKHKSGKIKDRRRRIFTSR
jgi:adenine-specific DNA-methyltransferase